MYRVYCNGLEFGIDYPTLEAARAAKRQYAEHFKWCRYYIRKATRPRLSQFVSVPVH
jgi:hypothetical protein